MGHQEWGFQMAEPLASMPRSDAVILFAYYSLLILIALVLAIQIWPDAAKLKDEDSLVTFGWYKATIRRESRLVLTVAVMDFWGGRPITSGCSHTGLPLATLKLLR